MATTKLRLFGQTLYGVAAVAAIIVIFGALIALGPFATIASLNTVFGLEIPYTFGTFLGMLWLLGALTTTVKTK